MSMLAAAPVAQAPRGAAPRAAQLPARRASCTNATARLTPERWAHQAGVQAASAAAAAGGGGSGRRRSRLQAAARSVQPQAEQHGSWLITAQTGYVEKAVAISRLLAESFAGFEGLYDEDAASPSPAAVLQYQLKLLAALQWRASTLGRRFVTVTAVDADSGELAGVANVTPGLVIAEASDHVLLGPGQAAAAVSNMAVAPQHRRRGLARLMLAACERAAAGFSPPATLMGLVVYRYNDAASALYESSGYRHDDTWVDERWAASAERGHVGFARRQLMLKPLDGAPWPQTRPQKAAEEEAAAAAAALARQQRRHRQ